MKKLFNSFQKIKKIFTFNKKSNNINNSDNNIANYNQSEFNDFLVLTENEPFQPFKKQNTFRNSMGNFDLKNIFNTKESKDNNYYKENWKKKEEEYKSNDEKVLFEELWQNISYIINNNLIDFTLIKDLSGYLNNDFLVQRFLFLLFNSIKKALENYSKEKTYANLIILKNNIIYFMIICLNLNENEKFISYLKKEKIEYLTGLISDIHNNIEDKENKELFNNILYNLFSTEYIHLDLNNNLNNENNNNISNNIINNFYLSKKDSKKDEEKEEKKTKKVIDFLFDLNSENFLNFNKVNIKDIDERFYHQLDIVQSILIILFSKEKYKYIENNDEIFYEYDFLNKVILKNILETKETEGDKYKSLFRKETLSNDILKYIFFIFGNKMLFECLVKPLDIILYITGINNEFEIINDKGKSLNMERDIKKEEFNILFDKILEKLTNNLPYILKIFLKMIYENIIQNFTIEKNNYIPLGVVLFFNYIASPRIQKIFAIHPHKYIFIKSMNRLLCNTCFNIEFGEKDPLKIFNADIKNYNKKMNIFFQNNIMNIDLNDVKNKKYIKNFFNEINVEYPQFLFYLSCNNLENIINKK